MKSLKLRKGYVVKFWVRRETTDEIADFGEKIRRNSEKGGGDYG